MLSKRRRKKRRARKNNWINKDREIKVVRRRIYKVKVKLRRISRF